MRKRGTLGFEVTADGVLVNNTANVERLRQLWLDRSVIDGELLGPGDPGDFDHGAWHVSCHLVAAAGVRRSTDGRLLWLEISHDAARDRYYASVTHVADGEPRTLALASVEGEKLTAGSTLFGFVEGSSTGRISAQGVVDPDGAFNRNPRQEYDESPDSAEEGGKVWEHWCTLRDIRPSAAIGSSVLTAYVTLLSALGDAFAAIVARGRHEYHHPDQLAAMVVAGLISPEAALLPLTPTAIPPATAYALCQGEVGIAVRQCETLDWENRPRYYMFQRKIGSWVDRPAMM
ncbi:MAG: hypothetical protein PVJ57_03580 [Phycisphaerae bacterium]